MMINDSSMKLFGRTIFVTHNNIDVSTNDSSSEFASHLPHEDLSDHSLHSSLSSSSPLEVNSQTQHDAKRYKETETKKLTSVEDDDEVSQQTTEELKSITSSSLVENPKTPSSETETSQLNSTKHDEQNSSTSLEKKMNVDSHEEKIDNSYQSFPPQFPWNPAMSYPVTFYPNIAYYGGCLVPSWSVQPISPQSCVPTLAKHSRDGNIFSHSNSEKEKLCSENNKIESNNNCVIPKTLRRKLFKGFASSKGDENNHVVEVSSSVLKANPAALSRSLVFHERI
ncbi:hypothetical protein TSUD_220840 [Trifolium subterraneum]|uniref:Uncharacterized protein n=1 Tax=Trifolium subterraneum TaxID=3900 RepID=A0A2Z6P1Y6_TRISU|nr:hypothetical protein TSUD_220840 [Trifolium subterraneum]